jgi:hypothetical protein
MKFIGPSFERRLTGVRSDDDRNLRLAAAGEGGGRGLREHPTVDHDGAPEMFLLCFGEKTSRGLGAQGLDRVTANRAGENCTRFLGRAKTRWTGGSHPWRAFDDRSGEEPLAFRARHERKDVEGARGLSHHGPPSRVTTKLRDIFSDPLQCRHYVH